VIIAPYRDDIDTIVHDVPLGISIKFEGGNQAPRSTMSNNRQDVLDSESQNIIGTLSDGTPLVQYRPERPEWICIQQQDRVIGQIEGWRESIHEILDLPKSISAAIILPDSAIGIIIKNLATIITEEDLVRVFRKAKVHLNTGCIKPFMVTILFEIIAKELHYDVWGTRCQNGHV
jgi:hypothetical protein